MLGNKIIELRKKAKLSQEQLAEKIEVTRQTISNWELGETNPDIVQAKKIAETFNISLDELTNNESLDSLIVENLQVLSKTNRRTMAISNISLFLILVLVFGVIGFVLSVYFTNTVSANNFSLTTKCILDGKVTTYTISYDANNFITNKIGDPEILSKFKSEDPVEIVNGIVKYYEDNNGKCVNWEILNFFPFKSKTILHKNICMLYLIWK